MADSTKRSRRPDSASMWDDDDRSRRRGGGRHRSRSRDRHDAGAGGGKGKRGGGGRRDRSTSRDRHARRRDDDRARSRSPRASDARDSARRRSPPRGPRSNARGGADNATNGAHGGGGGGKKGSSSSFEFAGGPTQPSSKEYTRRIQSRIALKNGKAGGGDDGGMDIDTAEDAADAELMRVMGFASFSSTHNTKVPGNSKNYAVRKEKKTEYRQYMNRVGGFNRPLSPSREV